MNAPELLTPAEAAEYLNITKRALYYFRKYGGGPAFVRLGHRTVRYEKASLNRFLAALRSTTKNALRIEAPCVAS